LQFQTFDESYVERLREGDFRTQEHFVAYFSELIQLKLRSRLHSPQAIEDVRQETFARVFAALRKDYPRMQSFARPGDFILNASSDYLSLSAYAARRASGAISLLVANRDTVTNLNAQITLNGFVPGSSATLRSFGIPQDEATRTNGPAAAKDIATNSIANAAGTFSYNFAPLSLSLFTLSPAAPTLTALSGQPPGQFAFQLNGQSNVRYYIQTSPNLTAWTTVASVILNLDETITKQ